ncbi:DUF551 domain-containing protein [Escherichia coli]|nr:DUF551 domain-containing protein [Escherichia coli]EIJ04255.1 PF04448 family protein [Escherichia coli B41]EFC6820555.1 DUF551 domain-containing protein [Escherichia coli]EFD8888293.1 DUF551 domain-containing protein [Escherichia coli]EHC4335772.1 DUF551 domain-containing protein [Escherichia coli]
MTTITKERLLTIKQWRETYGPGSNVVLPAEEAEELARIALASLEAEPIGEVSEKQHGLVMDGTVDLGGKSTYRIIKGEKAMKLLPLGTKFYTAPPAPITPEAIENAIEYIRSIAFHIDEDDYHGKHIAYFMRQALAWLEGHSCSDDRQGKAENQPVRGNQAAESNRGNEWTGNPDIDNAIIMLYRIDTAESYDDDRIEAVKAVLRRLAGNSPVTPDGWISCSEQMPDDGQHVIILCDGAFVLYAQYRDGEFFDVVRNGEEFFETQSRNVTDWMPLPEPPQEVK